MSDEVLMLAKNYDRKKVKELLPVVLTEKLDGAAADFCFGIRHRYDEDHLLCRSRQGEQIMSVDHIINWLSSKLKPKDHLVAELFMQGLPFKDISGMVRQHDNAPQLVAHVYDFYNEDHIGDDYQARMIMMVARLGGNISRAKDLPVKLIPGALCKTMQEFDVYVEKFTKENPHAEGLMIRPLNGPESKYKFGRSWGMQRLKPTGSADLRVHSFEEAEDKNGQLKGMVGRINVVYSSGVTDDGKNAFDDFAIVGAGPGKLTHQERIDIWNNQSKYIGRIAEIAYKPDDSYASLREPRFLRWRDDKTQPNQE